MSRVEIFLKFDRILHKILQIKAIYVLLSNSWLEYESLLQLMLGQGRENFDRWAGQNKWTGWNFFQKLINEQVPNKASREGKSRKRIISPKATVTLVLVWKRDVSKQDILKSLISHILDGLVPLPVKINKLSYQIFAIHNQPWI